MHATKTEKSVSNEYLIVGEPDKSEMRVYADQREGHYDTVETGYCGNADSVSGLYDTPEKQEPSYEAKRPSTGHIRATRLHPWPRLC